MLMMRAITKALAKFDAVSTHWTFRSGHTGTRIDQRAFTRLVASSVYILVLQLPTYELRTIDTLLSCVKMKQRSEAPAVHFTYVLKTGSRATNVGFLHGRRCCRDPCSIPCGISYTPSFNFSNVIARVWLSPWFASPPGWIAEGTGAKIVGLVGSRGCWKRAIRSCSAHHPSWLDRIIKNCASVWGYLKLVATVLIPINIQSSVKTDKIDLTIRDDDYPRHSSPRTPASTTGTACTLSWGHRESSFCEGST